MGAALTHANSTSPTPLLRKAKRAALLEEQKGFSGALMTSGSFTMMASGAI